MIYTLVQFNVKDVDAYADYAKRTAPIMENYGGVGIAAGKPVEFIYGEQKQDNKIIVKFKSKDDLLGWLNDSRYTSYTDLRNRAFDDLSISILNEL